MTHKLSLYFLLSMFLLLCGVAAQATAHDVKLNDVTNQSMIVTGVVDKPNVDIILLDPQTNQIIGQATAKADAMGTFLTKIMFSASLKDYVELVLNVTDSDNYGNKTILSYSVFVNCWERKDDPCELMLHSPRVVGEDMG